VIGTTEQRRAEVQLASPGAVLARTLARVRDGELGPIPVFVALLLIGLFFQLQNDNFLTPRNLSNLVLQIGVLAPLAFGVVLVLLVGEIDLSIAAVSGFCAGTLAVLLADHGWNPYLAMVAVILLGAGIGIVQGACVVSFGIPSFVVTLGGLLVWQGALLALLSNQGEKLVQSTAVTRIASSYLSHAHGWAALAVGVPAYAAWLAVSRDFRRRAGLRAPSIASGLVRLTLATGVACGTVALLNGYFGVPWVLVILLFLIWLLTLVVQRTALGRHIYAVGGDREAARRAGINVAAVKMTVFGMAGALAGVAGILAASRAFSVSNATGGGNLLLDAIAAAVIGGTSLFGGRGLVYQGLLGALVIGSVENGFDLLGQSTATKSIATGIILVVAVGVDALSRRRRLATGTAGA
jgi:D-xylose transport system permease protein